MISVACRIPSSVGVGPHHSAQALHIRMSAICPELPARFASSRARAHLRSPSALLPSQLTFFFNDTATTEIYTLSLHDALPTLRARWRSVFRRKAPDHLPRHLLFRILAYRLQAERLGDLDKQTVRLLERMASGNGGNGPNSVLEKQSRRLQPGSMLVRE